MPINKTKLCNEIERREKEARNQAKEKGVTFYDRAYKRGRFMALAELRINILRGDFEKEVK